MQRVISVAISTFKVSTTVVFLSFLLLWHQPLLSLTTWAHTPAWLLQKLFDSGYSAIDIITTVFRVTRNSNIPEFLKLEFLKVRHPPQLLVQHVLLLAVLLVHIQGNRCTVH